MSIAMLEDYRKVHDLLDDFESTFWSLLFGALKFFAGKVTLKLSAFYWYDDIEDEDGNKRWVGGSLKRSLISGKDLRGPQVQFECMPLRALIAEFSKIWKMYYIAEDLSTESEAHSNAYEKLRAEMSQATYWTNVFDAYLAHVTNSGSLIAAMTVYTL